MCRAALDAARSAEFAVAANFPARPLAGQLEFPFDQLVVDSAVAWIDWGRGVRPARAVDLLDFHRLPKRLARWRGAVYAISCFDVNVYYVK